MYTDSKDIGTEEILTFITQHKLFEMVPNVVVSLRILLTLPIFLSGQEGAYQN